MKTVGKEIKKHYLFPSAIFAERQRHIIDTVLGSCVSVCLYDPRLKIGGINHYMLPLWNGKGLASPKYGNIAIEKLVKRMISLGCFQEQLIAKVFGGANQSTSSIDIGGRNIIIAKEMLQEYNIKIVAQSVGGHVGKKIRFDTHTGEVLLKKVSKE